MQNSLPFLLTDRSGPARDGRYQHFFVLFPHQPWRSRPPSSQSSLLPRQNILFQLINSWYPQHGRDITSPSLSTRHCPSLQQPHLTSWFEAKFSKLVLEIGVQRTLSEGYGSALSRHLFADIMYTESLGRNTRNRIYRVRIASAKGIQHSPWGLGVQHFLWSVRVCPCAFWIPRV